MHAWSGLRVILAACELLPSAMFTLSSISPSGVSPSSQVRFSSVRLASRRRRRKTAMTASTQQPTMELAMVTMVMTENGLASPPEVSPDAPTILLGSSGDGATGAGGGGTTKIGWPFSLRTG